MRAFESDREVRRFVTSALVGLGLIGIVVGVASGQSVSEAAKALLTPDAGTATFFGLIVFLNLGACVMARWRRHKRQPVDAHD